jgi:ABC-type transport system involved in multi-copper enzyme maturation permease subunit
MTSRSLPGIGGRRPALPLAGALNGIVAIGTKELRGRMRGRRAFVVLTVYLALLAVFAWMVQLMNERTVSSYLGTAAFASAQIGREIFKALLLLETVLVVFLAPSFTAGAISLEREKQTLDLLAVTPISSPAIVVGKLVSALAYLFLLIVSSIPLMAIVFVFGGVAPDDVLRGYLVLAATAIGLGSVGLFFSALARRTQAATVLTYFTVLAVTAGTAFVFAFWSTMASSPSFGGVRLDQGPLPAPDLGRRPPAALMWLNPLAAQADVACGAQLGFSTGDIFDPCYLVAQITATSDVGIVVPPVDVKPMPMPVPLPGAGARQGALPGAGASGEDVLIDRPRIAFDVLPQPQPVEVRYRDRIWPASVLAWLGLSGVLVVASVWFVGPTRRPRFGRSIVAALSAARRLVPSRRQAKER